MSENGNNGSNGNGKPLELVRPIERTAWINPSDVRPFTPTARMVAFRDIAVEAAEEGRFSRVEWMKRSKEHGSFQKIPMRQSEWQKWTTDMEFHGWFYDAIPQAQERDEYEKKMMDNSFWSGLEDGLREKKEWAYSIYSKVRFGGNGSKNQTGERQQLRDFIGSADTARKWKGNPAEA